MRTSLVLVLLLAAGCTSVENRLAGAPAEFTPPLPEVPERWASAGVVGSAETGDWVAQFDDEVLYDIIVEAITGSPQIKQNQAQAEAAAEAEEEAARIAEREAAEEAAAADAAASAGAGQFVGDISALQLMRTPGVQVPRPE